MTNSVQLDNGIFFAGKIYSFNESMRESYYHILSGSSVNCVLTFIVLLHMSITDPLSRVFSKSIALSFVKSTK